jgi:hypothetical protein
MHVVCIILFRLGSIVIQDVADIYYGFIAIRGFRFFDLVFHSPR